MSNGQEGQLNALVDKLIRAWMTDDEDGYEEVVTDGRH
jgi:hypothetical protein